MLQRNRTPSPAIAILLLTLLISSGCEPTASQIDPAVLAKHRATFLLKEKPTDAVTILTLRETPDQIDGSEITLVGIIGGMPNPWKPNEKDFPWKAGEATFFLVDPTTTKEFANHATEGDPNHEDCAFCARRASQSTGSIAAVTFLDESGKPIPIGAQELFGLKANTEVIIKGKARLLAGDLMVVEASGVYVGER